MFFSSTKAKLTLIIDVQSSIVRGTLVLSAHGATSRIVNTHSISVPHKPKGGSSYLIDMALRAVEEVVRDARMYVQSHKHHEGIPNKIACVHYVLSSPWIVSQAKTLSMSFEQDTVISQAFITGMIWEERSKMVSNTEDDVKIIEEKVFDVRLNGYSVASWESRHTRELGVSFIVSIAGGRMINRFIDECRDIVRPNDIKFHSSLFLQHLGIQIVVPGSTSYALVHAHGELTDVAVINQRSCTFFGSYPYGVHTMIRDMADKMKTTDDTAESMITMVLKGELDKSSTDKETKILDELGKKWLDNLKKLISNDPSHTMPQHIIVSSRAFDDFFMKTLKAAYPDIKLEMLTLEQMEQHVHFDPSVGKLRLSALYALAVHSL